MREGREMWELDGSEKVGGGRATHLHGVIRRGGILRHWGGGRGHWGGGRGVEGGGGRQGRDWAGVGGQIDGERGDSECRGAGCRRGQWSSSESRYGMFR